MVIHTESVYGSGSGCTCSNNIATEITHVDDTPANNRTTHFTYDWRNRRIATSGELNAYSTVTYDNQDRVLSTSQFDGENGLLLRHATTTYDDRSRVYFSSQAEVVSGSLTGNSIDQQQTHDQSGNVLVQTPAGNATNATIEYDDLGRSIKQTNPLGDFSTTTYNNIGQQAAVTNLNGHTSTMTYDPLGRLIASTTPLGHTTQRHYNAKGELHQTTDANGNTTTQTFDAASRLLKSTDPEGHETTITYDAAGNQLTVTNALGHTTSFTYDHLDRLTSTTDPLTNTTQTLYNRIGEVIEEIDAKLQSTTHTYNALGQKVSTTNRLGDLTTYTYNSLGQQLSMTDPETQTTSYLYDSYGRRIQTTWPDHIPGQLPGDPNYGITTTTYDNLNRILRTTDQLGDTITHTYNNAGHLTQRDYRTRANSPTGTISDSDTFTYNAAGNLLTATKGRDNNVVTYTYDNDDRTSTEQLTAHGNSWSITRQYDGNGNLTSLTYPDGTVVTNTYTTRNQLSVISDGTTSFAQIAYDEASREISRTLGNGRVRTTSYFDDGMVKMLNTPGITKLDYTYDANRSKLSETITGNLSDFGFTATYDNEDRLISWNRTDTNLDQSWSLSEVGNFNTFTENSTVQNRTHGPTHEIQSIDSASLTHDEKGNLTTNTSGNTYIWNSDNLLASTTIPSSSTSGHTGTHTYTYDALGRRVSKTVNGVTTVFVSKTTPIDYSPFAGQILCEYSSLDSYAAPTQSYSYGTYIDEPITKTDASGNLVYYHRNQQYSVVALSTASGQLVEEYVYEPYGKFQIIDPNAIPPYNPFVPYAPDAPVFVSTSAYGNRMTYTGREYDKESDLFYFRARMYDVDLGRFLSRDAVGYVDGHILYGWWIQF